MKQKELFKAEAPVVRRTRVRLIKPEDEVEDMKWKMKAWLFLMVVMAFVAGFLTCMYVQPEYRYLEKLTWCHDKMKTPETLWAWRQSYCKKGVGE